MGKKKRDINLALVHLIISQIMLHWKISENQSAFFLGFNYNNDPLTYSYDENQGNDIIRIM